MLRKTSTFAAVLKCHKIMYIMANKQKKNSKCLTDCFKNAKRKGKLFTYCYFYIPFLPAYSRRRENAIGGDSNLKSNRKQIKNQKI